MFEFLVNAEKIGQFTLNVKCRICRDSVAYIRTRREVPIMSGDVTKCMDLHVCSGQIATDMPKFYQSLDI